MKLSALLSGCLLATAVAMPAAAQKSVYTAVLDGPSESPANTSSGMGSATVTIDSDLKTMRVQESFSLLAGGVTASHIHCCTTVSDAGTAGVATTTPTFTDFPSGVTNGSYDHIFDMTLASSYNASFITASGGINAAFSTLVAGLNGGNTYVNIHTDVFPSGEISGFLHAAPVPEPETYAMLLAGLAIISMIARRRHI